MSWVKLDDNFPDHPKVEDTSDAAFRLHIAGMCHCARNLTNGFVSRTRVRKLTGHDDLESLVAELVEAGLWHVADGGWQIHDYLDYNFSAEQVRAQRQKTKDRVERWREAHKNDVNAVTNDVTAGVSNAVGTDAVTDAVTGAPTRPDPVKKKDLSSRQEPRREDVQDLCKHLQDRVIANGSKPPTKAAAEGWRRAARLMLDTDKRDLAQAHQLIDWCQDDEFWRGTVRSMPKFREQYDALRLKAHTTGLRSITRPAPSSFEAIREAADCETAARLLDTVWREPAQPMNDRTPASEWQRAQRLAWINAHEPELRARTERTSA